MMYLRTVFCALVIATCLTACKVDPSDDDDTVAIGGGSSPGGSSQVSATVEWDIPQTRENGEAMSLGEIGGYEILYRNVQQPSYTSIVIEDHTADNYVIRDLSPGEYEVMVAAFDTDGLFSDYSDPIIASIGI